MDFNLIRTFLEVCQTRHFTRAAENLHLTGSAVSARIRTLEEQLGVSLFLRLRNGIQPTPTAERLITQFRGLLATWEQVRFLVSVESAPQPNLVIAASAGVWESLGSDWIKQFLQERPDTRLRLEVHSASDIARGLQQGNIDFGLTLEQLSGSELASEKIGQLNLSLMSDTPGRTLKQSLALDYLHIDWSTSFNSQFLSVFPDYLTARITVTTARLATNLLIDFPGAAYLPMQIVDRLAPHVVLSTIQDAPSFSIPVFTSYAKWTEKAAAVKVAIESILSTQLGKGT